MTAVPGDGGERILRAVAYAADRFLRTTDPLDHVDEVLAVLGEATEASRVYVFEVRERPGTWLGTQRYEWCAPGIEPQLDNPDLHDADLLADGFGHWVAQLSAGEPVVTDETCFTAGERAFLGPQGIRSLVVVPIEVEGRWWGWLGYDDTVARRRWSASAVDAAHTAARILGAGIQQQHLADRQRAAAAALRVSLEREQLAAERLRELDTMKDTFLRAVSHELRTPLTTVHGLARTLRHHDAALAGDRREQALDLLLSATTRLKELVEELLDLDRLHHGPLVPQPVRTDLPALVQRSLAATPLLADRGVEVRVEVPEADVDPLLTGRILDNLLQNAGRYTDPDVAVRVAVLPDPVGLRLVVEDEGAGIPAALHEAVFTPFHHGPRSLDHAPGVGIGLSLVARFATGHGGRAWVEDRPGGGARFQVVLATGTNAAS